MCEVTDYTHIYFIVGIVSIIIIFIVRTIQLLLSEKENTNQIETKELLSIEQKNYYIEQVTQTYQMDRIDHIDQIIYRNKYYSGDDCMNAIKERYLIFKYGK